MKRLLPARPVPRAFVLAALAALVGLAFAILALWWFVTLPFRVALWLRYPRARRRHASILPRWIESTAKLIEAMAVQHAARRGIVVYKGASKTRTVAPPWNEPKPKPDVAGPSDLPEDF